MSNTSRTWISMFVAIVVLLIVIFTMPDYPIIPRAIFLPAEKVKAPYNGPVAIYTPSTAPFYSDILGVINLRYHTNNFSDQNQDLIFNTLKQIAAAVGGNGVVLDPERTWLTPASPSSMQVIIATGTVIFSEDNNSSL